VISPLELSSARATALAPSPTLLLDTKLKEMSAQGENVLNLCAGEPDFPAPDGAREMAIEAVRSGQNKYTAVAGIERLRKRIAEKLSDDNGLTYSPDDIVVSVGAKHALFNAFFVVCDPGDEVLIPGPYWVSYPEQARAVGAVPVMIDTDETTDFKVTPEMLSDSVTARPRVLVLNNPSNPTGSVYSRDELEAVAAFALRYGLVVVEDLIYEYFYYGDPPERVWSIAEVAPEIKEQTIIINGVSKACGMTGWCIGYSASTGKIAGLIKRFQGQTTSNPCAVAQYAALGAMDDIPWHDIKEFRERRDLVVAALRDIPGVSCREPAGAFYVFPNVAGLIGRRHSGVDLEDTNTLCAHLLETKKLGIVPGSAFGSAQHVRLSYAVDRKQLADAMSAMKDFVAEMD
jgi:aspartate aminotransferase